MPFVTINTNAENKDRHLAEDAARLAAEILGKPISYVVATVRAGQDMAFDGSSENKGALIEVKSVGFADKAELARRLTELTTARLDVEARFVNIEFVNLAAADVAIAGRLLG
ncbi:MAG: hypothetical protein IJ482_04490 [Alphaproteobacteria bacterium]|nr:hypothetical protein [Alphaproteobacteria bacterium]